jgi:prefoldin subunit 5
VLEEDKETVEALKDRIAELEKDIETQRDTILAQSAVNERFLQYFENVAECIQYYDEFVNELDSRLHQVETRVFSSASEAKPSFKERSY